VSRRTETSYKAESMGKAAQTCQRPRNRRYGKWRGCTREVYVLIRGDLFSERHNDVSCGITGGGYRLPNVPAQMTEDSASFVRYETKMSGQETDCAAS